MVGFSMFFPVQIESLKMKSLLWKLSVMGLLVASAVAAKEDDSKKDSVGTVIGIDLGTTYSW